MLYICCVHRGGGVTHHSIMSYQERLQGYLEQLAMQPASPCGSPRDKAEPQMDPNNPESLFRLLPATDTASHDLLLGGVGRLAGVHTIPNSALWRERYHLLVLLPLRVLL